MESGASPSPRVLVVDDDPDVLASLERGLRLSGFEVSTAVDGAEALRSATETRPDAIVLDINMPVLDGVSVVTALRAMDNDVPVCVLSARTSVDDRVAGLEAGADDYLVKPFAYEELSARLRAMVRRMSSRREAEPRISNGPIVLDEGRRLVTVNERAVDLSRREFTVLETLLRHAGQVMSRDQLLDAAWPYGEFLTHNTVDTYIHYLRAKLGEAGARIQTVRGIGYRMAEP